MIFKLLFYCVSIAFTACNVPTAEMEFDELNFPVSFETVTFDVDIGFIKRGNIPLGSQITESLRYVDKFCAGWEYIERITDSADSNTQATMKNLKHVAYIQSIGSTTRIEGSQLDDSAVERLVEVMTMNHRTLVLETKDDQEVAGAALAMQYVNTNYKNLVVDEALVLSLHEMVMKFSSKDAAHRGAFKSVENYVFSTDTNGNQQVWLYTSSAADTPLHIRQLLAWYHSKRSIHPIVRIAVFVVTFLKIHPFEDGNGRISRLLTHLMLLQHDFSCFGHVSIERFIEKTKMAYYLSLRSTQKSFDTQTPNWMPWLEYFVSSLKDAVSELRFKIDTASMAKVNGEVKLGR